MPLWGNNDQQRLCKQLGQNKSQMEMNLKNEKNISSRTDGKPSVSHYDSGTNCYILGNF